MCRVGWVFWGEGGDMLIQAGAAAFSGAGRAWMGGVRALMLRGEWHAGGGGGGGWCLVRVVIGWEHRLGLVG